MQYPDLDTQGVVWNPLVRLLLFSQDWLSHKSVKALFSFIHTCLPSICRMKQQKALPTRKTLAQACMLLNSQPQPEPGVKTSLLCEWNSRCLHAGATEERKKCFHTWIQTLPSFTARKKSIRIWAAKEQKPAWLC